MSRNFIIILLAIAAVAVFSLMNLHEKTDAHMISSNPAANPANGLVAPEPTKSELPATTQTPAAAPMDSTASAPAAAAPATTGTHSGDDVPAGVEVAPAPVASPTTANPTQPASTSATPSGMAVPASEGQ